MSFDSTANNLVRIPIASAHTSGATSLVLGVSGTAFPAAPFRITAITGATYGTSSESLTIFGVTAVATNSPSAGQCTLTVAAIESTSDQNYGTSDFAEMRLTAGTISDLNAAAAAIIPGGPGSLSVGASGQLNFASQAAPGSPANGDVWHDSTQHCLTYQRTGQAAYVPGLIYSQVANVTVTASGASSLASAAGATGSLSLPAGHLNVTGRLLRIRAGGYYSTTGTQGTITFALKLGSNVIATTPATTWASSRTNAAWTLDAVVATKATGASGALDSSGLAQFQSASTTPATAFVLNGTTAGTQGPATQPSLDLTAAYALDLQATLSVASQSITLTNFSVEVLG